MLNRKQVSALTLVGALLLSGLVTGTAAIGAAESPTEITNCTTIDESGEYVLAGDIQNESAWTCLSVQSSDVTIDGNGHTVDGVDMNGTGIGGEASENVTVRDVTVTGFGTGVATGALGQVTILDSRIERNGLGVHVELEGAMAHVEDSVIANNSDHGVFVDTGSATIVDSKLVDNGAAGVKGILLADVTLRDNLIAGNAKGVHMGETTLVSENNTIRDNAQVGIYSLSGATSTNDLVEGNGVGIHGYSDTTLMGTVVRNNTGHGVLLTPQSSIDGWFARINDSTVVDNGGDGVHVDAENDGSVDSETDLSAEIHNSTIADNDGLGVNNTEPFVLDATGNDWGAEDGPGSADDADAPFKDPRTGRLADGDGDEVSEHPEMPGVSNVHFTTKLPEVGEGDDDDDDEAAYQFDVVVGDVIKTLGDDRMDFYGRQKRLIRAQTFASNGTMTGHFVETDDESYTEKTGGCHADGGPVDYDRTTGEVTATLSLGDDADCGPVTMTFAAYELPGDDVEFVRAHADDQELVAYQTVTLEPGESVTVTLDVNGDDE